MSVITIRTDQKLKKDAQSVLRDLGLDLSSAINVFLRQIVRTGGIPFPLRTVNGFTPEQERAMRRDLEEALKSGKRYTSVDALFTDILGEWPEKKRSTR